MIASQTHWEFGSRRFGSLDNVVIVTRLDVAEASAHMLAGVGTLSLEDVPLACALRRVLARDVISPVTLPPWDNASMDGFAVRTDDVRGATRDHPVRVRVVATVPAGVPAAAPMGPGEAVRIMTGAPVPFGTDTVVRIEDTVADGDHITIIDARDAGRNVRLRGEDIQAQQLVLRAGTVLGAPHLGVLAAVGCAMVRVHRRPRVAILATGDEIVPVERFAEVLSGNRIVSSNSYSLAAAVELAGGEPMLLRIAPDDPAMLATRLRDAEGCDLVITTGGVSVGDFDYTRDVIAAVGGRLSLWRVRMRPGAPLGFGSVFGVPWLGLPGNPVSALVTFELFGRPIIRTMIGDVRPHRRTIRVRTAEALRLAAALTHYLRVTLEDVNDGPPLARLTGAQSSGMLTSLAFADALLVVPPELTEVSSGTALTAIPLGSELAGSVHFPA